MSSHINGSDEYSVHTTVTLANCNTQKKKKKEGQQHQHHRPYSINSILLLETKQVVNSKKINISQKTAIYTKKKDLISKKLYS